MASEQSNVTDAPSCSHEKMEILNAQKRAKSVCKAGFTRYKNQLFGLLDEDKELSRAAIYAARCKLSEAFEELVEISNQLSKAYEANGEANKCNDVYEEVEKLIEICNEI